MDNNFDVKELQAKLEKFAGFKEVRFDEPPHEVAWIEDKFGHVFTDGVPDLLNNPKDQQDYLYPKLIEYNFEFSISWKPKHPHYVCIIDTTFSDIINTEYFYGEDKKNSAMAFALACEKLIDGLEKKQ